MAVATEAGPQPGYFVCVIFYLLDVWGATCEVSDFGESLAFRVCDAVCEGR